MVSVKARDLRRLLQALETLDTRGEGWLKPGEFRMAEKTSTKQHLENIDEALNRLRWQRRTLIAEAAALDIREGPNVASFLTGLVELQEQIDALKRARDDEKDAAPVEPALTLGISVSGPLESRGPFQLPSLA
jgi:hypothetical protein